MAQQRLDRGLVTGDDLGDRLWGLTIEKVVEWLVSKGQGGGVHAMAPVVLRITLRMSDLRDLSSDPGRNASGVRAEQKLFSARVANGRSRLARAVREMGRQSVLKTGVVHTNCGEVFRQNVGLCAAMYFTPGWKASGVRWRPRGGGGSTRKATTTWGPSPRSG